MSKNRYFRLSQKASNTLPQYGIQQEKQLEKRIGWYLALLKACPCVRFVGITGSSAVEGYKKGKDIDIFIIARHRLLWTTRFFSVLCAKLLSIRGREGVCLNLFFDEDDILIPQKKQNSYIGHELLQMKPIIDKGNFASKLLFINKWIYSYFPNAPKQTRSNISSCTKPSVLQGIDSFFKSIQISVIRRNKTGFLITDSQLWLFKSDFEKKLKRKGLVI